MKTLLLNVLFVITFSQITLSQTKPVASSDNVNFQSLLAQPGLSNQDVVTRSNSISLDLDTLHFFAEKDGAYFISLRFRLYSWKDNTPKPEPTREFGFLFKETVKTKNGIASLTNLDLTSNQSLSDINFGDIEVKIVQEDSKSNVTDVLNSYIKKAVTSTDALGIIDLLLAKQKIPAEQLIFKSGFEVPLNSIEYQLRYSKRKENVLINNERVAISLDGSSKCELLRGSVLGNIVSNFTKILSAAIGTPEAKAKISHKGILVLSFTTEKNSLLPQDIKDNLVKLYSEMSANTYDLAHNTIDFTKQIVLKYYNNTRGEENQRVFWNALKYLSLADLYIDFADAKKNVAKNADSFDDFYNRFSELYADMTLQQMNIGLMQIKTDGIYDGASTSIFLPYALDEVSLRNFLLWQVRIHQLIKKKEKQKWLVVS